MANKKTICGELYVEMETGFDAEGNTEIYGVESVSFMLGKPGKSIHLDITDYSSISGRTVAERLYGKSDLLIDFITEQDRQEREQAEQDAAEQAFERR